MEIGQQLLLSAFGIILGFILSQSFNIVKYIRRPKFRVSEMSGGVISSYTGGDDEPGHVELGFYLENSGWNVAKDTRVFISNMRSAKLEGEVLEDGLFHLSELQRPLDIIPPGESIRMTVGKIVAGEGFLEINLISDDAEFADIIAADTRGKFVFRADFYIVCEDPAAFKKLTLTFDLTEDSWSKQILVDDLEL